MSGATVGWQTSGGIGSIVLRRPPLNILDLSMLRELEAVLASAADSAPLKLLELRAEGKTFSAGVEVADHTPDKVREMIPLFDRVCTSLAEFPAPTLAVVQGHALGGGCELALACDLVIAAAGAKFAQPEIKLGVFPPMAALWLSDRIGFARAAEMLLTGEPVLADEAARMGLINRAVAPDELEPAVRRIEDGLRGSSAAALATCKRALRLGRAGAGLAEIERLYLQDLMASQDSAEGLAAFLEKRAPVWSDR
jgi:cyclohexa-1,5-dienecarbonyl-CoA hydratase